MADKLKLSDFRIERLTDRHDLSSFMSYEKDLEEFLKFDALDNQNLKISVTYL